MMPAFRAFVGGPVGAGTQYMAWVHLADTVRALEHAIDTALTGPFNITAPEPVTMDTFARALGQALGRPAVMRVPAFAVKLALGDRSESVEGVKSETAVGLIVVSLADDTETVKAARGNLVGGAILEKVKGNYSVTAGAPATFVGAMHKMSANSKLTLKVGASTVVIDGSGVTIESPIVMLTGATIKHTKNVADG